MTPLKLDSYNNKLSIIFYLKLNYFQHYIIQCCIKCPFLFKLI